MNKIFTVFLVIASFCSLCFPVSAMDFSLNDEISSAKYQLNPPEQKPSFTVKTLPANTPVIIKNNNTIDSDNITEGNTLQFSTVNDIRDSEGNLIIAANSPVIAKISYEKSGILGKSAKLFISDFYTTATDGTIVPLTDSITITPNNKKLLSIALGVGIFPAFLLMKGNNAKLAANSIKTVYTANETSVRKNIN